MRIALGDFRFIVPTFAVEKMDNTVGARLARQEVIGSAPITHLLGPETDTMSWESTFFPLHLNRLGLDLLVALQEATRRQIPLPMLSVQGSEGTPMGRWIITSIGAARERFAVNRGAQIIQVSMEIERYQTQGQGRGLLGIF